MGVSRRKRQRKRRAGGSRARNRAATLGRELEQAVDRIARRALEAHAPDTPPERIATILLEDFAGRSAPGGFALSLAEQDSERPGAVAAELDLRAPGSALALTFAAEIARALDGDPSRAEALLDEALDTAADPADDPYFPAHLLAADRVLAALELADERLELDPGDSIGQETLAAALGRLHERAEAGTRLGRAERAALARFSDRTSLERLWSSIDVFVAERPALCAFVSLAAAEWRAEGDGDENERRFVELLGAGESPPAGDDTLARLALEYAWTANPEPDDESEDEDDVADPQIEQSRAPLARLATDATTPHAIALTARAWLETRVCGLWQVANPTPAPGVWLTEVVSGVRRYAAVPPEQLERVGRWGVLMGTLVALDGIWRTTGAVVHLRPAEAEEAAALAIEAVDAVAEALAGKRVRRAKARRAPPQPRGVLVEVDEAADPIVADLISTVLGNLLPTIASEARWQRATWPPIANTDGDRLKLITAQVDVRDPAAVVERLAVHPDLRVEDDGVLTWWGRDLTTSERETMLGEVRARYGPEAAADPLEQTPRWLRGRLSARGGGFEVDVNSEQRLAALLALLDELDAGPTVSRRTVFDPPQDLPPMQRTRPLPFGASAETIDAWEARWLDERTPALGGLSPRVAATRGTHRPRLEALLREFEHDADLLARAGRPAPSFEELRAALGMEEWWAVGPTEATR